VSEVTFKVSKAYYLKSVLNGDRANKEWWYFNIISSYERSMTHATPER